MKRTVFVIFFALALGMLPAGADHQLGHTTVFATVGQPGMPEGMYVCTRAECDVSADSSGTVYVSTHTSVRGNSGQQPSKILRYALSSGALIDSFSVEGQSTGTHGLLAMAFDAAGRLYILDRNPSRILRFSGLTGVPQQETYATFPELPQCKPVVGPTTDCAPVTVDEPNFPDYIAFDAAGNAYVTDLQAATIWRVTPGGTAELWYQDARLDGIFGPNGVAIGPDGMLYFAQTGSQQPESVSRGVIYRLPLADPGPEDLETVYTYADPAGGPDGIAFGASGKLYVAMAGANQISVLDVGAGTEVARFPDAVSNQMQEIPYDLPATIAFDGEGNILVTNQSFFLAEPSHWAVLRAWVNDTAFTLYEPTIG